MIEETMNPFRLVLASGSPQRIKYMKDLHVPFEVIPAEVEEATKETDPTHVVRALAKLKGDWVFHKLRDGGEEGALMVLSADTICSLDKQILGKPKDREEAKKQLMSFSGREHYVHTGVQILYSEGPHKKSHLIYFEDKTQVLFNPIDQAPLEKYLDSLEWQEKAGSYAFQGGAQVFIRQVEGSYSTVIGLPIDLVYRELETLRKKYNFTDLKSLFSSQS
jgi:septum formation protein